jgi:acetate kinase
MGFSPTSGLMMGTRCGDVDPVMLLHLLRHYRMNPSKVARLVSLRSGLLGTSGISQDVRVLLSREKTDGRAREALDLFCHTARKYLGGLCAVLGGIDTLVFMGGIGEHAAVIRERICADLEGLGIVLDRSRNRRNVAIISADKARVVVLVMRSNENVMIARHVFRLLGNTLLQADGI